MNLKATNKYLFDQVVDCKNCFHNFKLDKYNEDWCSMSAMTSLFPSYFDYHSSEYCRSIHAENSVINHCGPLGTYYEPKE